jgi:hypothetical protein
MFREVERPLLRPLPDKEFELFTPGKRIVDVNGLVEVDKRFYPVPTRYLGHTVIVHFNQKWVKVYDGVTKIIQHQRHKIKGSVTEHPDCRPEWKHPNLESQELYYLRQARKAGPGLHDMVSRILMTNDPLAIRRVRGVLGLLKKFGPEIVDKAAAEARRRYATGYRVVKSLCERIEEGEAIRSETVTLTQQHELIRPLSEYEFDPDERNT